jgi:multidrug efflux pump
VPKGFFPQQDTGLIQVITQAPANVSFADMSKRQQSAVKLLLQNPQIDTISSFIGVDTTNSTLSAGRMQIALKPHSQRSDSVMTIIRQLQQTVSSVDDLKFYFQPIQDLTIEDRVSRTQYQLTLENPDAEVLAQWVPILIDKLRTIPQLADVVDDLQNQGLSTFVEIDREAATRLGVTTQLIDDALNDAFSQRQVSTVFTQSNQYRVVVEVAPEFRRDAGALDAIYVQTSAGKPVPLSSVAKISERRSLQVINRIGQFPAVTISFNLAAGASLSQAVELITSAERELEIPLSIRTRFQGAAQAFEASLSSTLLLILAAIVTMYIVLGILYESFIHPITILSTLPSAAIGALLALLLTGRDLDMIGIIGIILLIGIVKKNAIMMIDFALDAERKQGLSPREAIHQAALLRFRPILMTTLAALFGAVPLMLATGTGAELRQPLGLVMVGGLMVSQVLTLFTTPVIYLFFDRLRTGAVAQPAKG